MDAQTRPAGARAAAIWSSPTGARRSALPSALLRPGDCLLVAGKGHEDYQIIGTGKFHFDDREELRAALAAKG